MRCRPRPRGPQPSGLGRPGRQIFAENSPKKPRRSHGSFRDFTPGAAKNINGRVLILHGAEDPVAPLKEVDLLVNELRAAKVSWQLELYSGTEHGFSTPKNPAEERANTESVAAAARFFKEVFGVTEIARGVLLTCAAGIWGRARFSLWISDRPHSGLGAINAPTNANPIATKNQIKTCPGESFGQTGSCNFSSHTK